MTARTARPIRGAVAAALAATLALTAAACSKPGGSAASAARDGVVVGIAYEPDTLSPSSATARTATPRCSTASSPSTPT